MVRASVVTPALSKVKTSWSSYHQMSLKAIDYSGIELAGRWHRRLRPMRVDTVRTVSSKVSAANPPLLYEQCASQFARENGRYVFSARDVQGKVNPKAILEISKVGRKIEVSGVLKGTRKNPRLTGGGGGIRTPETLSSLTVFKTAAFNHSATPPILILSYSVS